MENEFEAARASLRQISESLTLSQTGEVGAELTVTVPAHDGGTVTFIYRKVDDENLRTSAYHTNLLGVVDDSTKRWEDHTYEDCASSIEMQGLRIDLAEMFSAPQGL